jgi:hypothetical protein
LLAVVLAVAVGAIVLAAVLVPRSPRFLVWRLAREYRDRERDLILRFKRDREPLVAAVLLRSAVERAAGADSTGRAEAVALIDEIATHVDLGPAQIREGKRALFPLLEDQRTCAEVPWRTCDGALGALYKLDDAYTSDTRNVPDMSTDATQDYLCDRARKRLEAELAGE